MFDLVYRTKSSVLFYFDEIYSSAGIWQCINFLQLNIKLFGLLFDEGVRYNFFKHYDFCVISYTVNKNYVFVISAEKFGYLALNKPQSKYCK